MMPPTPNDVPGACEYVPLHGKRDGTDVIKRILSWGDYLRLSRWTNVITQVLTGGRQESQSKRERCYAAGTEDGGRGQEPRDAGNF